MECFRLLFNHLALDPSLSLWISCLPRSDLYWSVGVLPCLYKLGVEFRWSLGTKLTNFLHIWPTLRLKRYLKFSFSTHCWSQADDQCLRKDKSTYMVSIVSLNLFLLWPHLLLLLSPPQDTLKLVTSLAWIFLHFSKPYGLYYHLHHKIHLGCFFISSLNLHSPLILYKLHYCFLL